MQRYCLYVLDSYQNGSFLHKNSLDFTHEDVLGGNQVNSIVKKAKITPHSNIVTAATDMKNASSKRFTNFLAGILWLALPVLLFFFSMDIINTIFSRRFGFVSFVLIIVLFVCFLVSIGTIAFAVYCFRAKSKWFLILYHDHLLFKYDEDRQYKEKNIPLDKLTACFIIQQKMRVTSKNGSNIKQFLGVYFQYTEDDAYQTIKLWHADGFSELNDALKYLSKKINIPFYLADVRYDKRFIKLDQINEDDIKPITFSGDLKTYGKK